MQNCDPSKASVVARKIKFMAKCSPACSMYVWTLSILNKTSGEYYEHADFSSITTTGQIYYSKITYSLNYFWKNHLKYIYYCVDQLTLILIYKYKLDQRHITFYVILQHSMSLF